MSNAVAPPRVFQKSNTIPIFPIPNNALEVILNMSSKYLVIRH